MCEGPLSKQGSGLFGGWNERWFRLTGNGLSYYQNPKAAPKFGEHATTIDISQGKYFRTHKAIENSIECVLMHFELCNSFDIARSDALLLS
jgi:hypothetical protein